MTDEQEKQFYEKILLAKIMIDGAYDNNRGFYRLKYREAAFILFDKTDNRALIEWFCEFGENLGEDYLWREKVYYLIWKHLQLPLYPQKWRGMEYPLEVKLKDPGYAQCYKELDGVFSEIIEKYRPLYEVALEGKQRTGVTINLEKGKRSVMALYC